MGAPVIRILDTDVDVVTYKGERVVTLAMIDRVHKRPEGTAKRNLNENKARFDTGTDFVLVPAAELRRIAPAAVGERGGGDVTLLTRRGYLKLVKSLNDDRAWQVQGEMIDCYFAVEALGQQLGALPAEIIEMIRRTDGISRMVARKFTSFEARLGSLEDRNAVPALDFGGTVTAYQIIEMAGVPLPDRQRGTAQMVTRRLMALCAEHQVACFRTPAEVNPSRPFRFPQAIAGEWLLGESRGAERIRTQVERMRDKKTPRAFGNRQSSLCLAGPGHPLAKRDPKEPIQ